MRVGPGGVFVGVFDPLRRRDEHETTRLLARAVGEPALAAPGSSTVAVRAPALVATGSLTVAVSDPRGEPSRPLLLVDGAIRPVGAEPAEDIYDLLGAEGLWRAYEREGERALEQIRGEFALLIYDADHRRGLLARDPLGLRPVFLAEAGGCLLFASEIQPLLAALPSRPPPDDIMFAHWLGMANLREPRTLFAGVRRLPPGCALRLEPDGWTQTRHWHWRYGPELSGSGPDLTQGLLDRVERSTAISLCSTRAPALLLSGGLDSSAVLSCAAAVRPTAMRTYSAVFPNHPAVDESPLIELQQRRLGLRGLMLEVHGGSVLGGTLRYLQEWGLPDISSNYFFFRPLLQRIAEDGADLLLDGEGGDELFETSAYLLADLLRTGRLISMLASVRRIRGIGSRRKRIELLARFGLLGALPARAAGALHPLLGGQDELPGHLNAATRASIEQRADPCAWRRFPGPRWWSFLVDQLADGGETTGAAEHHLRLTRPWGLGKRHPLRDLDLVLWVLRLPAELSFDRSFSRPLQRRAFAGRVPEEILLRTHKSYFDSIRSDSLLGTDLPLVRELLLAPDAQIRRYTRPERVRELIERPPATAEASAWGAHVMQLLTGECWLRQQADQGFAARMLEHPALGEPRLRWRASGPAP
jgi:asparagine synthase (glutamine-hydrolysing)